MGNPSGRLRVPPRERFAGRERVVDLDGAFAELPRESVPRQGHIQKTLYRLGRTTTAIFAFDAGGGLDQYTVEGEATVHVLKGRLRVTTPSKTYDLGPNQLLLLDPGVPHDLSAEEATRLLMTVVLKDPA